MRWFAVGEEATGVIAIGQQATGVIAIGQLATGVIAIGQLARGVIVVGQLALGVVCIGQLAVGVAWAGGMLGIGGTTPGLFVLAPFGRVPLGSVLRLRPQLPDRSQLRIWKLVPWLLGVALWVTLAGRPLLDDLRRTDGILGDDVPATTVPERRVLR